MYVIILLKVSHDSCLNCQCSPQLECEWSCPWSTRPRSSPHPQWGRLLQLPNYLNWKMWVCQLRICGGYSSWLPQLTRLLKSIVITYQRWKWLLVQEKLSSLVRELVSVVIWRSRPWRRSSDLTFSHTTHCTHVVLCFCIWLIGVDPWWTRVQFSVFKKKAEWLFHF